MVKVAAAAIAVRVFPKRVIAHLLGSLVVRVALLIERATGAFPAARSHPVNVWLRREVPAVALNAD
jgi:hypothetical protein